MEGSNKGLKFGRVSFPPMNDMLEKKFRPKDTHSSNQERALVSCCYSFDVPKSPIQAMEFLSRSWSPSSSDFFHILSSNNLLLPPNDVVLNDEGKDMQMVKTVDDDDLGTKGARMIVDHIWTWPSKGKYEATIRHNWMSPGKMKSWLRGEFLRGFSISGASKQRKKEERRLHAAEIHAALSVAQLAAAVAGIVSNSSLEQPNDSHCNQAIASEDWNKKISQAVASAAGLIATVCAEAAESAGAHRAQIASAMSLGLGTQNASDMLALTATAATCLRGAATLGLRAKGRRCVLEHQEMLARGSKLPICSSSGKIQAVVVSIYLKHEKLALRLGKKYLQGAITRHKEYRIMDVLEDRTEDELIQDMYDFCFLTLGTTGGVIRLLFEDEKQCKTWTSSISHFLSDN